MIILFVGGIIFLYILRKRKKNEMPMWKSSFYFYILFGILTLYYMIDVYYNLYSEKYFSATIDFVACMIHSMSTLIHYSEYKTKKPHNL
jgi:hypothetical protein